MHAQACGRLACAYDLWLRPAVNERVATVVTIKQRTMATKTEENMGNTVRCKKYPRLICESYINIVIVG